MFERIYNTGAKVLFGFVLGLIVAFMPWSEAKKLTNKPVTPTHVVANLHREINDVRAENRRLFQAVGKLDPDTELRY